jgi:hypothetical protein
MTTISGHQRVGGVSTLTSPSVHSEVDTRVLGARRLSRRAEETLSRQESPLSLDRLAPAKGILFAGITGLLMWITLIGVGYFLIEAAGL